MITLHAILCPDDSKYRIDPYVLASDMKQLAIFHDWATNNFDEVEWHTRPTVMVLLPLPVSLLETAMDSLRLMGLVDVITFAVTDQDYDLLTEAGIEQRG